MVYKYHRINNYLYDLLLNNEFYFATPDELNDPADCNFNITHEGDENAWRAWLERFTYLPPKAKESLFQFIKGNNFDEKKLFKNDGRFNQIRNSFGITCFSEKKDIVTMWSHYADSHKGICIGFEPQIIGPSKGFYFENLYFNYDNPEIPGNFYPLTKIEYKDAIPEPYNNLTEPPKNLFKFIKTKHSNWSNEEEYRLIIDFHIVDKNIRKYKFRKDQLKEVTFGMNVEDSNKILIKDLITSLYTSSTTIEFYQSKMNGYNLEFDKI